MPIPKTSSVKTDTIMKVPGRIHENIARIKGEDKRISSREEAIAILEYIPRATVLITDDRNLLWQAGREAQYYLEYGDTNVRTKLTDVCRSAFEKGKNLYAKLTKK